MRPFLISLAVVAIGCSTGRYDADYAKAVSAYRDAARTVAIGPAPAAPAAGEAAAEPPPEAGKPAATP
jgi:hypothetical protein